MAQPPFKKLVIWRESYRLALEIYRITHGFPFDERFGLTSQIRKSAVSIPANIAEGIGRSSVNEMAHFLYIAIGSAQETICHCMFAKDLRYSAGDDVDKLIERYNGLIIGIRSYIKFLNGLSR